MTGPNFQGHNGFGLGQMFSIYCSIDHRSRNSYFYGINRQPGGVGNLLVCNASPYRPNISMIGLKRMELRVHIQYSIHAPVAPCSSIIPSVYCTLSAAPGHTDHVMWCRPMCVFL